MQILPENIKILINNWNFTWFLSEFHSLGGGGGGGYMSHLQKNAKIKPKFLPFLLVNCFKTLHIS
jgi:hypothetical protein